MAQFPVSVSLFYRRPWAVIYLVVDCFNALFITAIIPML